MNYKGDVLSRHNSTKLLRCHSACFEFTLHWDLKYQHNNKCTGFCLFVMVFYLCRHVIRLFVFFCWEYVRYRSEWNVVDSEMGLTINKPLRGSGHVWNFIPAAYIEVKVLDEYATDSLIGIKDVRATMMIDWRSSSISCLIRMRFN